MIAELEQIENQALAELRAIDTLDALRGWRNRYLGKTSAMSEVSKGLGKLSPAERPAVGQRINTVKRTLEQAFAACEQELQAAAEVRELQTEQVDVTMPGRPVAVGHLHPLTQVLREIEGVFARLGFSVWDSREVESDLLNFELLNLPPHHPSRDMHDTFYVQTHSEEQQVVMRTHTSPGQIHAMRYFAPGPTRVILPGKCYRNEAVDATHDIQFYQVEGIAVGESITMGDLKGTLAQFAAEIIGAETEIRFRPSYFPFTEPSVEVDVSCTFCQRRGCRMCKYTGWIEILGAGMIHPTVLRNGGYDPDKVSGFAFGMGPGRVLQLKYGVNESRLFFTGNTRFLEQF